MREQHSLASRLIISDRSDLAHFRELESSVDRADEIASQLSQHIVGQEDAIRVVANALAIAEAGLNEPDKPLGIFLFTGPTGVGKTELARAIAQIYCGGEDRLNRVDCSEFQQEHTVHNLVGSPPGYVGYNEKGRITHDWLHATDGDGKPRRSVVLFDELEKAHSGLHDLVLGIMDRAILTARDGDKGQQSQDYRNTIIVLTSNAGAGEMQSALASKKTTLGFERRQSDLGNGGVIDLTDIARDAIKRVFRPEFLNRIGRDHTVVFKPLTEEQYCLVLEKLLEGKNRQILKSRQEVGLPVYRLYATEAFASWITGQVDKNYGGRDLKNILLTRVYPELAKRVGSNAQDGIVLDVHEGRLRFLVEEKATATARMMM